VRSAKYLLWLAFLSILLSVPPAYSDIRWNGTRVPDWPEVSEDPAPALGKASASPVPASIYPNPKGTLIGATFLVDFSDNPARRTRTEIMDWLNGKGFRGDSCNGSVRDYFADMSNGQLDFWNDVFGYYRAKHPKSFYEETADGERILLEEVLVHFDPQVDFSRYDNDKDGSTEAVSIVYAGTAVSREASLWPHAGYYELKRDSVSIPRYQMTDLPGPATDLVLKRALEKNPGMDMERVKPWRGYAAAYLWHAWSAGLPEKKKGKSK